MVNPLKVAFIPGRNRLGRLDYLVSWISSCLIFIVASILVMMLLAMVYLGFSDNPASADERLYNLTPLISMVLIIPASIYCGVVLGVKRLHDIGRSGKWVIPLYACYLANIVGSLLLLTGNPTAKIMSEISAIIFLLGFLTLLILPGSKDKNTYGPVPPRF